MVVVHHCKFVPVSALLVESLQVAAVAAAAVFVVVHFDEHIAASAKAVIAAVFAVLAGLLGLVAMILKPYLHLCGRQVEQTGDVLALLGAQVLLVLEALLELVHLRL